MNKIRLIRRTGPLIPGGYPYVDPKTNMRFDGFECGDFDGQVRKIIAHRLGNPKLYPPTEPQFYEYVYVADSLDTYQCQRLGNSDLYCIGVGAVGSNTPRVVAVVDGKCGKCGGELQQRFCPTCGSGNTKLVGYICKGCGKIYDR